LIFDVASKTVKGESKPVKFGGQPGQASGMRLMQLGGWGFAWIPGLYAFGRTAGAKEWDGRNSPEGV
jgi:hypothetical protein